MTVHRTSFIVCLLAAGLCFAQVSPGPTAGSSGNFIRIEGGLIVNEDELHTARETDSHSGETPNWSNPRGFEKDVFTFTRVIFQSDPQPTPRGGRLRWLGWWVDYPDADLNLSYRLQQLTTIRTDPDARVVKLTDPAAFRYPLLYLEHAGYMRLSDEERAALRRYLEGGGALFVNDFWSAEEWDGFAGEIARVLPGRRWEELTPEHPLFHCVYDVPGPMSRMQIPTMQFWNRSYDPEHPQQSPLQTYYRGEGSEDMHVRALFDDQHRMVVVAIHNSDVSDGWERESENTDYFNQFSEKIAYPLGINVIFYLMTH